MLCLCVSFRVKFGGDTEFLGDKRNALDEAATDGAFLYPHLHHRLTGQGRRRRARVKIKLPGHVCDERAERAALSTSGVSAAAAAAAIGGGD